MIESHVFGTKRSYRMQERNGQIEWVSNDSHLIKFNNLLQMWQVVNATTSNQIGEGKIQSLASRLIFKVKIHSYQLNNQLQSADCTLMTHFDSSGISPLQ